MKANEHAHQIIPDAVQTPRLAALIGLTERLPRELGAVSGMLWIYWEAWSPGQREHFLGVIEREFPDLGAAIIEHLEWSGDRPD